MTIPFQIFEASMTTLFGTVRLSMANILARLAVFVGLIVLSNYVFAQTTLQQAQLQRGFATAQTCEPEIDDDLDQYQECVGHAINALGHSGVYRLGAHFQAWLIADLAARQNSATASEMRHRQRQHIERLLITKKMTLTQLAVAKKIAWLEFSRRWDQRF